ncbi:MAG: Stp1/IreP family PP2C-type Ser/Thr phosphatase [Oscillospiraceae bacterium]|nr:Stp1/IreP family PP2C-type Ser/Thr phosphatase [Oscillospiraceae bacterium]
MIVAGRTDKGIVRKDNQDHFEIKCVAEDKVVIAVVCDGMGGAKAGNVASRLAAETFAEALANQPGALLDDGLVEDALRDAVTAANRVVHEMARTEPGRRGMGTTLVGVLVREQEKGKKAYILNVGDSRAYHISGENIVQITRDHSLVAEMLTRGDITQDEAMRHPHRNLITRVVGTEPQVTCDLFQVNLQTGDRLLLCSDGLTNTVTNQEMLEEIQHIPDLDKCCDMLITLALAAGGPDNITAVMIRI